MNVFIVTFDRYNAYLLNTSVYLKKKNVS